jgi:hypothetical protein
MAKLKAAARNKLPLTSFGLPKSRGFPMQNASHDRAAISGATRAYNAGNISKGTETKLKAKAKKKLKGK